MPRTPFRLALPEAISSPIVVASPHSGRVYDAEFMSSSVLDEARIRSSEDAYVDLLLEGVPALGLPVLMAEMPRAFLDLNRAAEELDPAVVQGVPRNPTNARISSGLGVIPRVVAQGRAIYSGKISRAEARDRIESVWLPYHRQLTELMNAAQERFGHAILLDCHSMPHEAIDGGSARQPEIVLGDRFGASADGRMMDLLEGIFVDLGFRVARNTPFAGAYITQAYGQPHEGWHAIQIEIDRALYLDEGLVRPTARLAEMRQALTTAINRFRLAVGDAPALAAE